MRSGTAWTRTIGTIGTVLWCITMTTVLCGSTYATDDGTFNHIFGHWIWDTNTESPPDLAWHSEVETKNNQCLIPEQLAWETVKNDAPSSDEVKYLGGIQDATEMMNWVINQTKPWNCVGANPFNVTGKSGGKACYKHSLDYSKPGWSQGLCPDDSALHDSDIACFLEPASASCVALGAARLAKIQCALSAGQTMCQKNDGCFYNVPCKKYDTQGVLQNGVNFGQITYNVTDHFIVTNQPGLKEVGITPNAQQSAFYLSSFDFREPDHSPASVGPCSTMKSATYFSSPQNGGTPYSSIADRHGLESSPNSQGVIPKNFASVNHWPRYNTLGNINLGSYAGSADFTNTTRKYRVASMYNDYLHTYGCFLTTAASTSGGATGQTKALWMEEKYKDRATAESNCITPNTFELAVDLTQLHNDFCRHMNLDAATNSQTNCHSQQRFVPITVKSTSAIWLPQSVYKMTSSQVAAAGYADYNTIAIDGNPVTYDYFQRTQLLSTTIETFLGSPVTTGLTTSPRGCMPTNAPIRVNDNGNQAIAGVLHNQIYRQTPSPNTETSQQSVSMLKLSNSAFNITLERDLITYAMAQQTQASHEFINIKQVSVITSTQPLSSRVTYSTTPQSDIIIDKTNVQLFSLQNNTQLQTIGYFDIIMDISSVKGPVIPKGPPDGIHTTHEGDCKYIVYAKASDYPTIDSNGKVTKTGKSVIKIIQHPQTTSSSTDGVFPYTVTSQSRMYIATDPSSCTNAPIPSQLLVGGSKTTVNTKLAVDYVFRIIPAEGFPGVDFTYDSTGENINHNFWSNTVFKKTNTVTYFTQTDWSQNVYGSTQLQTMTSKATRLNIGEVYHYQPTLTEDAYTTGHSIPIETALQLTSQNVQNMSNGALQIAASNSKDIDASGGEKIHMYSTYMDDSDGILGGQAESVKMDVVSLVVCTDTSNSDRTHTGTAETSNLGPTPAALSTKCNTFDTGRNWMVLYENLDENEYIKQAYTTLYKSSGQLNTDAVSIVDRRSGGQAIPLRTETGVQKSLDEIPIYGQNSTKIHTFAYSTDGTTHSSLSTAKVYPAAFGAPNTRGNPGFARMVTNGGTKTGRQKGVQAGVFYSLPMFTHSISTQQLIITAEMIVKLTINMDDGSRRSVYRRSVSEVSDKTHNAVNAHTIKVSTQPFVRVNAAANPMCSGDKIDWEAGGNGGKCIQSLSETLNSIRTTIVNQTNLEIQEIHSDTEDNDVMYGLIVIVCVLTFFITAIVSWIVYYQRRIHEMTWKLGTMLSRPSARGENSADGNSNTAPTVRLASRSSGLM